MAEHSRTLHYDRESQSSGVRLYTTRGDVTNPTVFTAASTSYAGTLSTTAADDITPALRLQNGSTTVYAKLGSTSDSNASRMRVNVNGTTYAVHKEALPAKGKALNEYTWAEISKISLAGKGAEYFNIGDCKEITLNGNVGNQLTLSNTKLCVFILDFNHPMNGVAENNIIFGGFKTALQNGVAVVLVDGTVSSNGLTNGTICFNMNHWGNYNYGGWKGCDFRYDILGATSTAPSGYGSAVTTNRVGYNATASTLTSPKANTLLAALPSDLRSNMRLWTRWIDSVGNKSNVDANINATVDAITLLCEPEFRSQRRGANQYEYNHNTQMAYYANKSMSECIMYRHTNTSINTIYSLSSPYSNSDESFCGVNTSGDANDYNAFYSPGLAPAFKI